MRTLEEYVAMIPTAPPDDIERYLDALGRKPFAVTSYRCISRDDAESRLDCEDFRADLRPSAAIRPAALWCSECESWYLAEYVPAHGAPCSPNLTYQNTSGVQVVNVEQDSIDKKRNGENHGMPPVRCSNAAAQRAGAAVRAGSPRLYRGAHRCGKLPSINAVVH